MDVPQDQKTKKDTNRLGVSRAVYALGNSVKDAFIWGTVAMVAVIGVVNLGRKEGNVIDETVKKLHAWHDRPGLISKAGEKFEKLTGKKLDLSAPVVAASLAVSWVIAHIVQIPSGITGWRQAQKAVDKYNNLADEKDQLVMVNAGLQEENQRFRTALEPKQPVASYAELVTKPVAENGVANSR